MQCVRNGEVRRRLWIYNVSLLEWSVVNAVGVVLKAFLVVTFECVPGSLAAGLRISALLKRVSASPKTPTSSPQGPVGGSPLGFGFGDLSKRVFLVGKQTHLGPHARAGPSPFIRSLTYH